MGKIIFWLVVIFAILFVLRLVNVAKLKRQQGPAQRPDAGRLPETMVRCHDCGVYLPREEAQSTLQGFRCRDGQCETRKTRTH